MVNYSGTKYHWQYYACYYFLPHRELYVHVTDWSIDSSYSPPRSHFLHPYHVLSTYRRNYDESIHVISHPIYDYLMRVNDRVQR